MKTLYANAFYTQYTTDELMITACVSTPMNDENGTLLAVQPQVRLAMTLGNAAYTTCMSSSPRRYSRAFLSPPKRSLTPSDPCLSALPSEFPSVSIP